MHHLAIANELLRNKAVFAALLNNITKEQYLWKPQPDKWCLLEIVCHLYDEEREDFRARIKHTLEIPDQPMPKIDPQAWVTERKYMEQDYETVLANFLSERGNSLKYLLSLADPDWSTSYIHPKMGPLHAQLFLDNWLAHDYLHFRQITRTKYQYLLAHSSEPFDYAGEW